MTIASDIQKLEVGNLITLFELDATALGGSITRFHDGTSHNGSNITWDSNEYTAFPIEVQGFEKNAQGVMARPTMAISNATGIVTGLMQSASHTVNDLVGAKLTRIRTFEKYLDAVNFPPIARIDGDVTGIYTNDTTDIKFNSGNIRIEARLKMDDYTPAAIQDPISMWRVAPQFVIRLTTGGLAGFYYGYDGTNYRGPYYCDSTMQTHIAALANGAEISIAVTRDGVTGDVNWYYRDEEYGEWLSGGTAASVADEPISNITATELTIGNILYNSNTGCDGYVIEAKVFDDANINAGDSKLKAHFNPRKYATAGDTSFTDRHGKTWTKYGTASFTAINDNADTSIKFVDDVYFISQKILESKEVVNFELTAAFDVVGILLPRRQVIQNVCNWVYRGSECGYAGSNYFDAADNSVGSADDDVCGKRLSSCKARFGANSALPFGAFPGVGLVR